MKLLTIILSLAALSSAGPALTQVTDEATARDLERLQQEIAELDVRIASLDGSGTPSEGLYQRVDELREEAVYLKVKMRHHRRDGGSGTSVSYSELLDVRRAIRDLNDDLDAAAGRRVQATVLEVGTPLVVRIQDPISSKTARVEDRVNATLARPVRVDGEVVLPEGTWVRGVVRSVERAERPSRGGKLELEFDAIYLESTRYEIHARVASIEEGAGDAAKKTGIGAVVGGVVGGIFGGKKGAIAGVLIGGGGTFAASTGEDVEIPEGTELTVRLERELELVGGSRPAQAAEPPDRR